MHLLLSSQRIEAGKLRGLDTYLSYRIGLRTFSESESAVVLDTPDAFHLPAIPGYGYLKVDTSVYRRFRAGLRLRARCRGDGAPPADSDAGRPQPLLLPTYNGLTRPDAGEHAEERAAAARRRAARWSTSASTGCARRTARSRPVWLPPLPSRLALSPGPVGRRRTAGQR